MMKDDEEEKKPHLRGVALVVAHKREERFCAFAP